MSNKSQLEIFGLVIIIILITIGLLFTITILTKPKTTEIPRVKESMMAANFLNTILQTSAIGCGKRTVRDLLQSCALVDNWQDSIQCENRKNACEYANEIISTTLNNTIKKWGKDYEFFIEGPRTVEQIKFTTTPCTGEREGFTRPERVRTFDIFITLWICR